MGKHEEQMAASSPMNLIRRMGALDSLFSQRTHENSVLVTSNPLLHHGCCEFYLGFLLMKFEVWSASAHGVTHALTADQV